MHRAFELCVYAKVAARRCDSVEVSDVTSREPDVSAKFTDVKCRDSVVRPGQRNTKVTDGRYTCGDILTELVQDNAIYVREG